MNVCFTLWIWWWPLADWAGRGGGFSALNWSDTQLLLGGTQNTIFAGRNRENKQNTELQLIDGQLHETQTTYCS